VNCWFLSRIPAIAAAILCTALSAHAQGGGATRPYRALFGGSTANPDVHHSFDVTASVEAAYEETDTRTSDLADLSPFFRGGAFSGFSTGVSYAWQGKRWQVGATGSTNSRYYLESGEFVSVGHSAGIGFSTQLGERGRLFANQSVSYSPSYMFGIYPSVDEAMPGAVAGVDPYPLSDQSMYVFDTTTSFSYGLSKRGSLEAVSFYRYSDLGTTVEGGEQTTLRAYSVGGRYRYGLTRYASLRLGYTYRDGDYSFLTARTSNAIHDLDVGVDYRRALSLTRRTAIDFHAGSAIVNPPMGASQEQPLQYYVLGDLGLTHEMGRTWRARLAYGRGVSFVEAFAEPVLSDGVNTSLTGFFNRRTDFSVAAGMSVGKVGLGAEEQSPFRTWNASARVRMAVSPMWAVYAQYLYSYQDLGSAVIVPTGVPSKANRQSLGVGITLWVPLLRR
jgi:hypothetical protein